MLTEEQIKANIDALQKQGASKEQIQGWLDSMKGKVAPATAQPTDQGGGFWKGTANVGADLVKAVAHPFIKVGSTIEGGLARGASALLGESGAGQQFSKVADEAQSRGATNALDFAGSTLEAASYAMAPVGKIGQGFWAMAKGAMPMAATFGVAKGTQKAAEGGSAGEVALSAAGNAAGALGGYMLLGVGGRAIARYGAKALQNPAMQRLAGLANGFAERVWNTLPEAFKETTLSGLTNLSNRLVYGRLRALQGEFDSLHKQSLNGFIDSTAPQVTNPELSYVSFARSLGETMGNLFRTSESQYAKVKADLITTSEFASTKASLGGVKAPVGASGKMTADEAKAFVASGMGEESALSAFKSEISGAISKGMNPGQIMAYWERAMKVWLPQMATNEEKNVVRSTAAGLYQDMRKELIAQGRKDLVNEWDLAHNAWKQASTIYDSGTLNNMKSSGFVSDMVDALASGKMTDPEKEIFLTSIKGQERAVQNLIISELLSKVRAMSPAEGAKLVDGILNRFVDKTGANRFFSLEQENYLRSISSFGQGTFNDFLSGMRQAVGMGENKMISAEATKTLTEDAAKLASQQEILSTPVAKLVADGRMGEIGDALASIKDPEQMAKVLSALTPEEKNVVGLSLGYKIYKAEMPIGLTAKDGSFDINTEFATTLIDSFDKIAGNKVLRDLLSDEQFNGLREAADTMRNVENIPEGKMKNILHGVLAFLYGSHGYMAGAGYQITQAIKLGADSPEFYNVIQGLVESGGLKANKSLIMGNLLSSFARVAGQSGTNVLEGNGQ